MAETSKKTEFPKGEKNQIVEIKLAKDFGTRKSGETVKMEYTTAKAVFKKNPELGSVKIISEVNITVDKENEDSDELGLKNKKK